MRKSGGCRGPVDRVPPPLGHAYSTSPRSSHRSTSSRTAGRTGFMSCFKRNNASSSYYHDLDQKTMEPEPGSPNTDRSGTDRSRSGDRFTINTSALVRQASTVANKAHKKHNQERASRETSKIAVSAWNILRRRSSADQRNSPGRRVVSTNTSNTPRRQFGSVAGLLSPRLSLDSDNRILRIIRKHTMPSGAQTSPKQGTPARTRMSIVAKDWDAVRKVHDPESDVGGVYVGEATPNGEKGPFTPIKISESTDRKLSMIDDEF